MTAKKLTNFRWIEGRQSWSRRKKLSNGSTAVMEFWTEDPWEFYDFGVWIAVIPPGRWKEFTAPDDVIESTGDGSCEQLPFFVKTLEDFIRLNPGKRIVAGAADERREKLYGKFLKRFGFKEHPYGYSWHPWAMVLDT